MGGGESLQTSSTAAAYGGTITFAPVNIGTSPTSSGASGEYESTAAALAPAGTNYTLWIGLAGLAITVMFYLRRK